MKRSSWSASALSTGGEQVIGDGEKEVGRTSASSSSFLPVVDSSLHRHSSISCTPTQQHTQKMMRTQLTQRSCSVMYGPALPTTGFRTTSVRAHAPVSRNAAKRAYLIGVLLVAEQRGDGVMHVLVTQELLEEELAHEAHVAQVPVLLHHLLLLHLRLHVKEDQ